MDSAGEMITLFEAAKHETASILWDEAAPPRAPSKGAPRRRRRPRRSRQVLHPEEELDLAEDMRSPFWGTRLAFKPPPSRGGGFWWGYPTTPLEGAWSGPLEESPVPWSSPPSAAQPWSSPRPVTWPRTSPPPTAQPRSPPPLPVPGEVPGWDAPPPPVPVSEEVPGWDAPPPPLPVPGEVPGWDAPPPPLPVPGEVPGWDAPPPVPEEVPGWDAPPPPVPVPVSEGVPGRDAPPPPPDPVSEGVPGWDAPPNPVPFSEGVPGRDAPLPPPGRPPELRLPVGRPPGSPPEPVSRSFFLFLIVPPPDPLRPPGATQGKEKEMSDSEIPITIAMSSDIIFKKEQHDGSSVSPGPVFAFVKALKTVNDTLREKYPNSQEMFRVLLISDNSSDSVNAAIREHGMEELILLTTVSEKQLIGELRGKKALLYLAAEQSKAEEAANAGIAAAAVFIPDKMEEVSESVLRVVFDGDAVLFSNDSELVFKNEGLLGFLKHEQDNVTIPMSEGPIKGFMVALERLKRKLHLKGLNLKCPIRTYLVTSRSAGCDGYRALNTLRIWGLEMDEAVFLEGAGKGPTLAKIKPHIFFDDQKRHVDAALAVGTLACLVPDTSTQQEGSSL